MKWNRTLTICVGILLTLSSVGCICNPYRGGGLCAGPGVYNYYDNNGSCGGCSTGCDDGGTAGCTTGCGTGGCDTDTNTACNPCDEVGSCTTFSASPCRQHGLVNCDSCLRKLGTGLCLTARGILDVAAAPFLIVGNLLAADYGYCNTLGSGSFGGTYNGDCCGEPYYGDNCWQPHDFNNPCNSASPCGFAGKTGCKNCNRRPVTNIGTEIEDGTVIEDIPAAPTLAPNVKQSTMMLPIPRPTRPVVQVSYNQPTYNQPTYNQPVYNPPKTKFVQPKR